MMRCNIVLILTALILRAHSTTITSQAIISELRSGKYTEARAMLS